MFLFAFTAQTQTIQGTFPPLAGQKVRLLGFRGLSTYGIDSTKVSDKGTFSLKFSKANTGVGVLMAEDNKPFFIILEPEAIQLEGEAFTIAETIRVRAGSQNKSFARYAAEHPRREQALSAWVYLEKIYTLDSMFAIQKVPSTAIQEEKKRIKEEDATFLKSLDPNAYVSWFLPTRKMVSSVSTIAQYRTEEVPGTLAGFRALDYSDPRLQSSGLLKDAVESHYWLIENMGKPLDSVFIEMNKSTDLLLESLMGHDKEFNEVTNYLFDLLERHSLYAASEYLALKVLNTNGCTVDANLAKQLETYRSMKKGNTAPDIAFKGKVFKSGNSLTALKSMSQIQAKQTLVVFGASWCPTCSEELPKIANLYAKWKESGLDVVFISLDTSEMSYSNFVKNFPFVSFCDFKKWESKPAQDYYVFGTPTMFILDPKRTILLRPSSVNQVDAWVDWYLIKGNEIPK
jgi:thiol-disulfide isomerase/thioredoxin